MLSLRDLQGAFAAALAAPASAGPGAADFDARLAIYRANGRANYRNALAATYPVVRRLTGTPFFAATVDAFVAAHPSCSGDLNVYGGRLAGFLERYGPAANLPYLPDVARLEWALDEANRAADAPRAPDAVLAALSIVAPERLPHVRLALDASCRLVSSAFPIQRIWRANQSDRNGDERIVLDAGGVALLEKLQPLAGLAMRLYVGKVFLVSGWLKLSRWDSTIALFENEYQVPVLSPQVAAVMATAGELGFSALLIAGLGTRAAALGLFLVNAVAVISYPDLSPAGLKDHVLWGALLLVLAIHGPGSIAVDRRIGLR